ncbi:hypothetical protein Kpho02_14620 [Kitasatospora phosalacinea]|uniref:Uncharacterized protein n=1 Tax=Kitasatospora phosalacinea TaxID=2065 RepID=A0A9W6Q609_9ACTN|nr:hypothetical protein Kpho02_14620 [Kitasatospora phosalacinea]
MCQGVGSVNLIAAPDALRAPVRGIPIPFPRPHGGRKLGSTILRELATARTQPACAIAAHPEAVTAPDSHPQPPQ